LSTRLLLVSSHVARFSGPWETVDPSTVGLSAEALDAAESAVSRAVNNRKCFLVVKEVGSLFGALASSLHCAALPLCAVALNLLSSII
jgi:hypothetical protein